ncbi:MAG: hypothetical protein HQM16_01745 [Deltaproteobacteria bacterium]|nr:hypothetical protein [Deltaproteobacteria bacterium]
MSSLSDDLSLRFGVGYEHKLNLSPLTPNQRNGGNGVAVNSDVSLHAGPFLFGVMAEVVYSRDHVTRDSYVDGSPQPAEALSSNRMAARAGVRLEIGTPVYSDFGKGSLSLYLASLYGVDHLRGQITNLRKEGNHTTPVVKTGVSMNNRVGVEIGLDCIIDGLKLDLALSALTGPVVFKEGATEFAVASGLRYAL